MTPRDVVRRERSAPADLRVERSAPSAFMIDRRTARDLGPTIVRRGILTTCHARGACATEQALELARYNPPAS